MKVKEKMLLAGFVLLLARMKIWPPSSTGIGIRFSSPRLRLIVAIRREERIQPACAALPDSSAMATGPINCLTTSRA